MVERIETVRAFSCRFTQRIRVLEDGFLDSPFALIEVRVLYEILNSARDRPQTRLQQTSGSVPGA